MNEARYIERPDGGKLAYRVQGEGRPLLLVMGIGSRAIDWTDDLLGMIGPAHRCIMYDHRGVGLSDAPTGSVTLSSMAQDAMAVLDEVGVDRCDVLGYSMGGMIAQRIALEHAPRVARLALISTTSGSPRDVQPSPEIIQKLTEQGPSERETMVNAMAAFSAPGIRDRSPGRFDTFIDNALTQPTSLATMMSQFAAVVSDVERHTLLGRIDIPTMVLTGDVDPLVPTGNSSILHDMISGSELVHIENCGHMICIEQPERLAAEIKRFFRAN